MRLLLLNSSLIIHRSNSLGSQVSVCTFHYNYVLMPLEYNLKLGLELNPQTFPDSTYGGAVYILLYGIHYIWNNFFSVNFQTEWFDHCQVPQQNPVWCPLSRLDGSLKAGAQMLSDGLVCGSLGSLPFPFLVLSW